jgi:CheY-like chemotaxis protein
LPECLRQTRKALVREPPPRTSHRGKVRRLDGLLVDLDNNDRMASGGLILVVDDDPVFRAVAEEALTKAGFEVLLSADGQLALETIAHRQPDLIFLDMLMPNKDGIETLREMAGQWPNIRVIAISGGSPTLGPDLLLRAAELMGAVSSVSKPLLGSELVKIAKREMAKAGA